MKNTHSFMRNKYFATACAENQLDYARALLCEYPTINPRFRDDIAFRWAFGYGHMEVVEWLLEVAPTINIRAANDNAFHLAIARRNYEHIPWLIERDPEIAGLMVGKTYFVDAPPKDALQVHAQRYAPELLGIPLTMAAIGPRSPRFVLIPPWLR